MGEANMSAGAVLKVLRDGPFSAPAHEMLYEVRSCTGNGTSERYADSLVVSTWPSRGIWLGGVEVKVRRSDWLRELADPEKSSAIQKFCDYWWIAAPEGVVMPGELPPTWGHYVVGKKAKLVTPAPELKAEALKREFVASILRNVAQGQKAARERGYAEGHDTARTTYGSDALASVQEALCVARNELRAAQTKLGWAERDIAQLKQERLEFERHAGLPQGALATRGNQTSMGAQWKAAAVLAQMPPERLGRAFRNVADALDALTGVGVEAGLNGVQHG